mmetsp:Transcript_8601/g.24149  ORF Transcript_8601/g.24149 Transcript_8601/m.24149 type:complete len:169 (+) Transcript_8601:440-946(+)
MQTMYLTDGTVGPPLKDGCFPALSHRIRIEFSFCANALHADQICGPVCLAMEHKWREKGFSLEVSPTVASGAGTGRGVSTGLDPELITKAVASNCFAAASSSGAGSDIAKEELELALPLGVGLRWGPSWIEVSFRHSKGGETVVVRRDFPSVVGTDRPSVEVKTSTSG